MIQRDQGPERRIAGGKSVLLARRTGFSLLELILVMAILLVAATFALPTVQRSFSRQAVDKGAGLLRASMGRARIMAIRTGEIHAVYYLPGFGWHDVAPFANAAEQIERATRRARQSQTRAVGQEFAEDLLPRGVLFMAGEAAVDARSAQAVADQGASVSNVKMVLFYPDGTSQDARIFLRSDQGDQRVVFLRGLTGTATVSKVENNR